MNPPLTCPGPVEKWFPLTIPAGNPSWQVARCYEHTSSILGGIIIGGFGLFAILIIVAHELWWWHLRRNSRGPA